MLLPAAFYIVWDIFFTDKGVWSFNEMYITGIYLYNLPVEEVLFFFIVPYCCVFIYECIQCYFPHIKPGRNWDILLQIITEQFFLLFIFYFDKAYTFYTFLFLALFVLIVYLSRLKKYFHAKLFLLSYTVILLPFLIVNGFLTAIPVVLYNDEENLGIKLYTIPLEDIFYGMLLILMNVLGFEYLRRRDFNK